MPTTELVKPAFGAFISYKRADEAFALKLEKALERYTPPSGLNLPQSHLNVFRDKEDLTGAEYHESIEKYLRQSAKLIVICSPHARMSPYVDDEIRRFAKANSFENIVPILVSGIPNNEATPDQETEKAFPDALCELMEIPLAADYRGFDVEKDRVDKGKFESSWYTVLANIYDISRSELEQRDRKRQASLRRIRMQIAGGVGVALLCLTIWALASQQKAVSRQLAAASIAQLSIDPEESILLATEALRASKTDEAEQALRRSLVRSHVRAVLRGHTGWVNDLSFSPGGQLIASASDDKTVRVWNVSSGRTVKVLQHAKPVAAVSFAPTDDTQLLTVSNGKTQVWNLKTGLPIFEVDGYGSAFSPDGRQLVTINTNGVHIWDAATGNLVWEHTSHPPNCATFSPDGRSLLTCVDATAELWRIGSRKATLIFRHDNIVNYAAFSFDGLLVVTASQDQTAKVWEISSSKSWMLRGHGRDVIWAGFARDDSRTVATIADKSVRLWTTETDVQVHGHTDWINSGDFSPDGQWIVTASQDGTARVWETKTGLNVADLLGHTDTVLRARFSPDGKVVATASADHTVRVWDVTTSVGLRGHMDWVTSATFDPAGKRVATSSWDGTARVWNAETGEIENELNPKNGGLNKIAFSPDGKFVVTAGVWPVSRVWDLSTSETSQLFPGHAGEVYTAAFSHDGANVITAGGQDGTVKIWNVGDGKEEYTAQPHGYVVTSANFSPDDQYILTSGSDQTAHVTNRATLQTIVLAGHTGIVYAASFSPDGLRVVTASGDMTARIWDARTGKSLLVLHGHTARLTDASFSPNGRLIVTASADKTARVWEAATGRLLVVFEHHADLVSSARFSPDGKKVITSSDDRTAKIVNCDVCEASIDELLELAKHRVTREVPADQQSKLSRFFEFFQF